MIAVTLLDNYNLFADTELDTLWSANLQDYTHHYVSATLHSIQEGYFWIAHRRVPLHYWAISWIAHTTFHSSVNTQNSGGYLLLFKCHKIQFAYENKLYVDTIPACTCSVCFEGTE